MPQAPEACDRYFAGKHVLVTGGSEGLGLAIAARAVRGGAGAVTLVARTRAKLDRAAEALRSERQEQGDARASANGATTPSKTLIQTFSVDVTDARALERAVREAERAVAEHRRAAAGAGEQASAAAAAARGAAAGPPASSPAPKKTAPMSDGGGGVDVLVAAAGAAECGYFHEAARGGAFARQLELNYLGVVHAVQAVYEGMVGRAGRLGRARARAASEAQGRWRRRRPQDAAPLPPGPANPPHQQHILIVASAMSLLNFVGYAAYSPSKWALRGLAEGLRNELQGSGIGAADEEGDAAGGTSGSSSGSGTSGQKPRRAPLSSSCSSSDVRVTIAFPPDVDTPGYARESLAKPPECAAISAGSALYSADAVARAIARGMAAGAFVAPNPSPVLALLQALCRGVVPPSAGPFASLFCWWGPAAAGRSALVSRSSPPPLAGWLALPLEMLLGFWAPLIASVAGLEHDGVARAMAPGRFARLWGAGA
jgi:NAD(P)-dependent dehydrogenase (short-subunit alcohol dehydrogenase family)